MIGEIIGFIILTLIFSGCTIGMFADSYVLNDSPADDTVLMLIGRVLFIPGYIATIPGLIFCGIFILIAGLFEILKERGVTGAIARFFNKKPLEFLKNYSVKIERRK